MIKPEHLLVFAKVAEHKNITKAAEYLHRSQPAISGQLAQLQQAFSLPLYRRKGAGVVLTDLGHSLLPYAQRMVKLVNEVEDFRRQVERDEVVRLVIGASTTIASYAIPTMLTRFHQQHPQVEVSLVVGNTEKILSQLPTLDAALVEGRVKGIQNTGFYASTWRQDEIVVIMSEAHPFAEKKGGVSLEEVANEQVVWREKGSGTREVVEFAFKAAGIEIAPKLELPGTEAIKEAVRAGLGIGLVSKMVVQGLPTSVHWRPLVKDQAIMRPLSLLLPEHSSKLGWTRKFVHI